MKNERKRAGPESFYQLPCLRAHFCSRALNIISIADMNDERVVAGSALRFENLLNRCLLHCIRAESIDSFRWESNQTTVSNDSSGSLNRFFLRMLCVYLYDYGHQ